ncbi:MAG: hypothetical protein ACJAUQ_000738 [Maribacter sp.]
MVKVSSYGQLTFIYQLKNNHLMEAGFVFISLFLVIFGIFYLFFSTRNRERLALIEKGADASIFMRPKTDKAAPFWKILILNIALLLMGIGAGIMVGGILYSNFNVQDEIALPGSIFLLAGTGLLIGFFLTKKLDKE